jgi:hypothetical protein
MVEMVNSSMIYDKNFWKCHSVPSPSTTIKKSKKGENIIMYSLEYHIAHCQEYPIQILSLVLAGCVAIDMSFHLSEFLFIEEIRLILIFQAFGHN